MTISSELARFSHAAAGNGLPAEVAERARLCVADHLHAALHGARSDTARLLGRYLGAEGVIGKEATALVFGALSTVHEIDDVHRDTSMHPGSVVVAAALGAASGANIDDRRLLAAIAIGYEVAIRLSIAAGERHYHYFQSTATCGTVAAAVTAAVVLGLGEAQTAHAIGVATSSASGLWEDINNAAIGVKHLHSGMAAERGVRAAGLARLGMRGARQSIEGEKGFLAALARPHENYPNEKGIEPGGMREILLEGLGERWAILRNIYKRYPFCLGCFEPLEGIRDIMDRTGRPAEQVASVVVRLYPPTATLVGQRDPQDQLQGKFSAGFAISLVLAGHDPENVLLPVEWLTDPQVRRWYPKIECVGDATLRPRAAYVRVTWSDGTEAEADKPLRSLEPDEVVARFAAACRERLGGRAHLLEDRVANLGSKADIADLIGFAREAIALAV
jgi:2-methylcitrate dehydratase PrpD